MKSLVRAACALFALSFCFASISHAQPGAENGQWPTYGGDSASTKYSPLSQIDAANFEQLKPAWVWESVDNEIIGRDGVRVRPSKFAATPLMVDGVLYASTAFSIVFALDAGTGETLWTYDPDSWRAGRPANMGFIHRGVSYWRDGDDERIIIATGHSKLIAIDARTGLPIESFGDGGRVDLFKGLNRRARLQTHQVNSPPVICRDVAVVGSVIFDRPTTQAYVRGDVRGFDVRTGELRWQFHSIPQEGEYGTHTWEDETWKHSGNTNVWAPMSIDDELGYVYLPFGAATNDFYGGHRHGDNLFANCLVCLDVETGERIWHFQTVHHDLWDYDLPCAPNLVDIVVDGRPIKAVAQVGKTGFCYVFDRVTGEPVWPIEEKPVPQSTLPGEKTAATQPFPSKPAPFARQGFTEDDLIDFTPELKEQALAIAKEYEFGPLFTPGTEQGVLMSPADGGGANFGGAGFDPTTSLLFVPAVSRHTLLKLTKPDPARSNMRYLINGYTTRVEGPHGLPLAKPPYSHITAIDLSSGEHRWMIPVGPGLERHPQLKDLDLPPTGGGGHALPLVTESLLIAGHQNKLFAFDKSSGHVVGEVTYATANGSVNAWVTGAPMTYLHEGKQYIVTAMTGLGAKTHLVALALP